MNRRPLVLAAVLACIGVPSLFVIIEAASFQAANHTTGVLMSAGERHEYIVHVPPAYDARKPTPLVLSMHGALNWPSFQMNVSQWNKAADEHGFIVAYPSGAGAGPTVFGLADVPYIAQLIDRVAREFNIDPSRVYANGLSNGGGMSFVLSCTMADRIAAVGLVAAAITMRLDVCPGAPPLPVIAFHGTGDRLTPYRGGKVFLAPNPFPNIPGFMARWADRNRCAGGSDASRVSGSVIRLDYRDCADGADVTLYTIEGGGHTWPGGLKLTEWAVGPTSDEIDATSLMWSFFRDHPLRQRR